MICPTYSLKYNANTWVLTSLWFTQHQKNKLAYVILGTMINHIGYKYYKHRHTRIYIYIYIYNRG